MKMKGLYTLLLSIFVLVSCGPETRVRTFDRKTLPIKQVNGCTDPKAFNYSPDAELEDGTCEFYGCLLPEYENFEQNEFLKIVAAYEALLGERGLPFDRMRVIKNYNCGRVRGCIFDSKYTENYNPNEAMGGKCIIRFCETPGFENSDPDFRTPLDQYLQSLIAAGIPFTGTVQNDYQCGKPLGCNFNNSYATNYDAGNKENGTCAFKYCGQQGYENYDANFPTILQQYKDLLTSLGIAYNGTVDDNFNCGMQFGCTLNYPNYVDNYQPNKKENGSCNIKYCKAPGYVNSDPDFYDIVQDYLTDLTDNNLTHSGDLDENYNCGKKYGCNFNTPYAENYDPEHQENGSCIIKYCRQAGYANSDPDFYDTLQDYLNDLINNNITFNGSVDENYNCGNNLMVTDNFTQDTTNKLDIVMVLDNSGSMGNGNEYDNVKNNLNLFIQGFASSDIDFQISVIGSVEDNNYVDSYAKPHSNSLMLTKTYYQNDAGNGYANFYSKFQQAINDYDKLNGGASEAEYRALGKFLDDYSNTHIRTNASLGVLIFTDEAEQSTEKSVTSWINDYKQHYSKVQLNCFVNKTYDAQGRTNSITRSSYVYRLRDGCLGTSGLYEEILDSNFYTKLTNFGQNLANLNKTFYLSEEPDPADNTNIKVYIKAVGAADYVLTNNWTYDAGKNAVVLTNAPAFGDMIQIKYLKK